jgi:hypothetical protein
MRKKILITSLAVILIIAGITTVSNAGKKNRTVSDATVASTAKIENSDRTSGNSQLETGNMKTTDISLASSTQPISSITEEPKKTQPATDGDALQSCANGVACAAGFICYHSQYAGMGPNGVINGKEEGDLLCHKSCTVDSDCNIGKCKTVEIYAGDVATLTKFCSIN